jgi:NAD(P)-dependent dehydrogenase (short-subunit alcohol dehydrogenase family)
VDGATRRPAGMIAAARPLRRADVLVNNAGLPPLGPIEELEESEFQRVMDVNVKGVFLGVSTCALRRWRGVILSRRRPAPSRDRE